MLNKNWKLKSVQDPFEIKCIADSLNISDILAKLLVFRGIKTFSQAKKFFRPTVTSLYDPFLMNGMDPASLRVIKALTENQKIIVYGDYDVDGTCSTALMYMLLKELGANVEYYIPNRLKDGYGISRFGIEYAKSREASLLISVDCGITAIEEADICNSFGIDLIICDHHKPKDILPNAFAVLDPLKPNCNYPFKFLSGAGVALKLAQGICERIGKKELPLKYLDLVALAGAADIVPLIDENRILVFEGLNIINTNPRPGIRALIENSRIDLGSLSSGQIVFTLAPRINAVGRLSDAKIAVELLISEDLTEATRLAKVLEDENNERKKIDENTLMGALSKVESTIDFNKDSAIILHSDDWHPGVIGIVASRLVEKYYRPTIMLTTSDGIAQGSARSISNFNIYEALKECEDLLVHFGGHEAAAGLAIELNKIDEFKVKFNKVVKEKINNDDLIPKITIDSKIKLSEITSKFLRIIEQFAPFGPGNMRPVFLAEGLQDVGNSRIVGNNHLLFTIRQDGCNRVFDSIGFDLGEFALKINSSPFNAVFSIDNINKDGKTFPQLKIKDIRIKDNIQEI